MAATLPRTRSEPAALMSETFDGLAHLQAETAELLEVIHGKGRTPRSTAKRRKRKLERTQQARAASRMLDSGGFGATQDLFNATRRTFEVLEDDSPVSTPRLVSKGVESFEATGVETLHEVVDAPLEDHAKDLTFSMEAVRVAEGGDMFVPAPSITLEQLQAEKRRLDAIEKGKQFTQATLEEQFLQAKLFTEQDRAAQVIQRVARGRVGRKKALLQRKIRDATEKMGQDWVEIHDRKTSEKWYYNVRTGASQWDRPPEMIDHVASPEKLKVLPGLLSSTNASTMRTTIVGDTGSGYDEETRDATHTAPGGALRSQQPNTATKLTPSLTDTNEQNLEMTFDLGSGASVDSAWTKTAELDDQIQRFMSTGGLFGPDGAAKPLLRDTVRNALRISKFDSVSSLLSHKSMPLDSSSMDGSTRSVQLLEPIDIPHESMLRDPHARRKMVAVLKLPPKLLVGPSPSPSGSPSRKRLGGKYYSPSAAAAVASQQRQSSIEGVTLHEVDAPGFREPVEQEDLSQQCAEQVAAVENTEAAKSSSRTKICFGCWSSGRRGCQAHQDNSPIDATESMVLCRNWDFSVMYRKYRSEEIQEIFEKQAAALRYDSRRKRFLTLVECKHVIYRQVYECIRAMNFAFRCRDRTKRWLASFAEQIKAGHVRAQRTQARAKAIRRRHTVAYLALVDAYSQANAHLLPLAPVTGSSWEEKNELVQLLIEHREQSTGQVVRCIVAKPIPEPIQLYLPRQYLPPAPLAIPMPTTNAQYTSPPLSNQHIADTNPAAWLERFSIGAANNAMYNALEQIRSVTPTNALEETFKSKYPPPRTVSFAMLCRKNAPNDKAVGGLSALLLIHQLVTTHVPVQFGGFLLMDRTTVSPVRSPDATIAFQTLHIHPADQLYVYRPVQHALNTRRPPTITVREAITDAEHLFYGNNRPEQTGEQEYRGFRTSAWTRTFACNDVSNPAVFVPHSDVATLNRPTVNNSITTRVDLDYPFCEPSSRDNTTLDFYHLLLLGTCSPNKPQVFTVMTTQEPGEFMRGSDRTRPLGHIVAAVYRSWGFTQSDPVEKFFTDDGVPYWYSKRTGQTFWEKPLTEEERLPIKEGGTRLLEDVSDPPSYMQRGKQGGLQTLYTQGEVRTYMTKRHEDEQAARARRRNAQKTLVDALHHGVITPQMFTDSPDLVAQKQSHSDESKYNGLPIGKPTADTSVTDSHLLDHTEEDVQRQQVDEQAQKPLSAIEIARGIAPVEMTPTPDDLYHQVQEASQDVEQEFQSMDDRLRKELPLVAFPGVDLVSGHGFKTHGLAGKGTAFIPAAEAGTNGYVKGTKKPLRNLEAPLPTGFFDAVVSTHMAKRNVDYLAQIPNLPRPRHVGRVKPRSSAVDWLAVGFDPWSAGKSPLNVEFIDSLLGKQDELLAANASNTAGVPTPAIDLEDTSGLEEQQLHISRAAKMAEDFKTISSLARHNKIAEIEELMSQPDWNLSIDHQDATGNTLLHVAAQNGNRRIAKLCLRLGANINTQNFNGQTALHYAYNYGFVQLGEYLISKGANDAIRNIQGLTCYEGLSMQDLDQL